MQLRFTKMQGLGNDFVVIDATKHPVLLSATQIQSLADRHFGIGFDQLLLVEAPRSPAVDFGYRIFNADGSEVEQCGNGARCFVRFVHEKKLSEKTQIAVETKRGVIYPKLEENGLVTVNMGNPILDPALIPFISESHALLQPLQVEGQELPVTAVSMGNPHVVLTVEDANTAPVNQLGPLIERHPRFPARVNVGFMEIVTRQMIRLRVFERGVGETLACGTGACAAVVAGILNGALTSPVDVETRGGMLSIAWNGVGQPVMMTGPAVSVFEGTLSLPDETTAYA